MRDLVTASLGWVEHGYFLEQLLLREQNLFHYLIQLRQRSPGVLLG